MERDLDSLQHSMSRPVRDYYGCAKSSKHRRKPGPRLNEHTAAI
jgi:hypothetical protein